MNNAFQHLSFCPHRFVSLPVCPMCSSYLGLTGDALPVLLLLFHPLPTFLGPGLSSAKGHLGAVPPSLLTESSKFWPKLQYLSISPHPPFAVPCELVIPFLLEHNPSRTVNQCLMYFAILSQSVSMIAQWVLATEMSHQCPQYSHLCLRGQSIYVLIELTQISLCSKWAVISESPRLDHRV